MSQSPDNSQQTLTAEAEQYIPNIDPAHENPKELLNYVKQVQDFEDEVQEEIDAMIEKELEKEIMSEMEKEKNIEEEEDSEDEDKWFPDYNSCACCHGFVYKCQGKTCMAMGQCYCKMKDDLEQEMEKCASDKNEGEGNENGVIVIN